MPTNVSRAEPWSDEKGNRIEGSAEGKVHISFRGRDSRIVLGDNVRIEGTIWMDCDNSVLELGDNCVYRGVIRVGLDCRVLIGRRLTVTQRAFLCAAERTTLSIGNDCMFAAGNYVRCDDAHAIYDRATGKRVNPSRDVTIGDHVWLGYEAAVLGGSTIGSGSVIGLRAVVKSAIPENCLAVGMPAKVVRENIAWERPHLTRQAPYFFGDREPYDEPPMREI